jgi:hypothetical protein
MAGNQISTSVSILNSGLSGFLGVSLTNYETSALSAIAAGSCVEIGGAFFLFGSETAINASSWTAITTATSAYLQLTPSGSAGSQIITPSWTAAAPVWSESKQGWYTSAGSIIRVIGSCYKASATRQETKTLYVKGRDRIFIKKINIGSWDMDATGSLTVDTCIGNIIDISVKIVNDSGAYLPANTYLPLNTNYSAAINGHAYNTLASVTMVRVGGGIFDGTDYNDTTINRGYIVVTYAA